MAIPPKLKPHTTKRGLIAAGKNQDASAAPFAFLLPARIFQLIPGTERTSLELVRAFNEIVNSGPVPEELADTLEVLAAVALEQIKQAAAKVAPDSQEPGTPTAPKLSPRVDSLDTVADAATQVTDAMLAGDVTDKQTGRLLYAIQLQMQAAKLKQPPQPTRPPGRPRKDNSQ